MAYERKIQRSEPGLIVLVLDDSGSMGTPLQGTSDKRCAWVDRYTQHIMKELLARCTEMSGDQVVVKPRYYLQAIIYGAQPHLWAPDVLDIEKALEKFTQENHSFGLSGAEGGTNTESALQMAYDVVKRAIAEPRFASSFPPMVFHLTDGETSGDPAPVAEQIKQLSTSDGNVLLVNGYIGTMTVLNYNDNNDFPGYVSEAEVGPSQDNLRLF
ncbi:MAG: vWA domain-containing protein, partial [Candidatus Xenobia bacterium]